MFGLYRYAWLGEIPEWKKLTAELQLERVELSKDQARAGRLPALQTKLGGLAEEAQAVRRQFQVTLEDGNPYVEMGFRSEDKVILTKVTPQAVQNKGSYQVLPVQMELRGSYLGQLEFIDALETLPNMSEITAISMTAMDDEPYPELRTSITLLLYSILDAVPGRLRGEWELGRFDIFSPALQDMIDSTWQPPEVFKQVPVVITDGKNDFVKTDGNAPVYTFPVKED